MPPVTKIYELKTVGFQQVDKELKTVEQNFKNIKQIKQELNKQALNTDDIDTLKKINEQVSEQKIRTAELRLEKLKLTNEAKASALIEQANTNRSKEAAIQAKATSQVQAGGIQDVINKQKELFTLLKNAGPGQSVLFQGQNISFDQAINEYKRLSAQEQAFRRQFQQDGVLIGEYTTGIVNAFKRLGLDDLVSAQAARASTRLRELDLELLKLKADLGSSTRGTPAFDDLERKLIANRTEAAELDAQIKRVQVDMRGMGDVGSQISTGISNGFAKMKGQLSQLLLTYVGFFAVFREAVALIKENAQLSDSFSDLQIRIHGSKEEVDALVESLKKIDTRTSLQGLVEIANIVSKKTGSSENLAELTQALDRLFIVLGKEIGDPSVATSNIVKLITVFNNDKHVTVDRVNEIGTALFKLTTSGVATGEFLIDFAERVGAVRGITGLTLPNILGMGAALQQLGQKVEVAGTAAVQLTTRLFSDVPKFAAAAKLSVEEFRKLLANNPFEALVKVAEGLKSLGDEDIATRFEDVITAFGEVGVKGVRVKAVLGEIATNADYVREKMKQAALNTADYGNEAAAADIKQHNFAATLDRIKKQFELLGTGKSVQIVLLAISTLLLGLIQSLPVILTLLSLLAVAWTVQNASLLLLRVQVIGYNLVLAGLYVTQGLLYSAQGAYIIGLYALRAALIVATVAARLFSLIISGTPLGFLITGISLLIGSYIAFGQRIDQAQTKVKGLTKAQQDGITFTRIDNEVRKKAIDLIGDQISKMEALVGIVLSSATSFDTSKKALEELISSNARFSTALQGNVINLNEVKRALAEVRGQIQLTANAQAASSLTADKYKNYLETVSRRQEAEIQISRGEHPGDFGIAAITDQSFLKGLKDNEADALKAYQEYSQFAQNAQQKVIESTTKTQDIVQQSQKVLADAHRKEALNQKLSHDELSALIQEIDKEHDKLKEGNPKLAELDKERDIFQARLDKLDNKSVKTKTFRGSRLTGEDKDQLNIIDAAQKNALAAAEKDFADLQLKQLRAGHDVEYDEEVAYLNRVHDINVKFLNEKIKLLEDKNSLNAKEKDQLATFRKELTDTDIKYIKDLQSRNKKQFDEENTTLKKQLELQKSQIEESQQRLELDPNISETIKAQSKKDSDDKIILLTIQYYTKLDLLAKKYSIDQKDIEEEKQKVITDLTKKGLGDQLAITEAQLKDISKAHERHVSEINDTYAKLRLAIIQDPKLNQGQKNSRIDKLNFDQEQLLLAANVAATKIKLDQITKDVAAGKKSIQELEDAETDYINAVEKFDDASRKPQTFLDKIQQGITGLGQALADNLGITGDWAKLMVESFGLAEDAMKSYFDNAKNRVEHDLKLNETRLDIELKQRKDRSQSQAESDSLDNQYALKKEKLERDAFEKNKKLQLQQLRINLAVQLANIAVAASANPLNPFTFGSAGIAQYLLQAGIALAAFAINSASIRSAQFSRGGNPDLTTTRGGRVKGRSHEDGGNPFMFKGRVFEDEVGELNIIRTKNVRDDINYTISGTHTQIASKLNQLGGGTQFQPGGRVLRSFAQGGALGTAPVFRPANSGSDLSGIMDEIRQLAIEQSNRIDRLEVFQVTDTVTNAQRKKVKQNEIGTL